MCIDNSGTRYSIKQMEAIDEARQLIADDQIMRVISDPRFSHEEMRELMLYALNGAILPDDATADERQEYIKEDQARVQARANEILEARRLNSKARNISERALLQRPYKYASTTFRCGGGAFFYLQIIFYKLITKNLLTYYRICSTLYVIVIIIIKL